MTVPDLEAAAAAMVEAGRAGENLDELMDALACCFGGQSRAGKLASTSPA